MFKNNDDEHSSLNTLPLAPQTNSMSFGLHLHPRLHSLFRFT